MLMGQAWHTGHGDGAFAAPVSDSLSNINSELLFPSCCFQIGTYCSCVSTRRHRLQTWTVLAMSPLIQVSDCNWCSSLAVVCIHFNTLPYSRKNEPRPKIKQGTLPCYNGLGEMLASATQTKHIFSLACWKNQVATRTAFKQLKGS